jgi:hypothetical protein
MSGHRTNRRLGYQCRIRGTYALPADDPHPKSVWLPEKKLVTATFDWLDEIFAPDNRQRVLEQIAAASTEPPQAVSQAASDLKDAGQRIDRLVAAVESGILAPEEVADKLRQLRDRRDRAKAVLAAAETTTGQLDPKAIADLLDQLGGLVAIEATLTDEERRSVLEESNLSIRYNHDTRTALFKVDLGRGVSVCVGGPSCGFTPTIRLSTSWPAAA